MATAAAPVLIERADIHKSCRALESIISILASYTEAANTLAVTQKKLAKALRDAASVKGPNNVTINAMTSSAGVFEGFSEVDVKFVKILDKETENAGNDLKKWFKKLAKEEKAHDERIAIANNKIKIAGQAYEKKAKRKDRDAVDEHSRYVAVLNAIGPEMSKDKYNHALFVTQRHMSTLSSFAASLSRLAEAEWIRACEHVRKSAPSIGIVGEWRVLCESGWSDPLPSDLPDLSDYDNVEKAPAVPTDAISVTQPVQHLTTGGDIGLGVKQAELLESPTSSLNSKLAQSTPISNEGQRNPDLPGSYPHGSRPNSPSRTREVVSHTPKDLSNSNVEQVPVSTPPVTKPISKDESQSPATSSQAAIPGNRVDISTQLDSISGPTDHVSGKADAEMSNLARKRPEHPERDPEDASLPEVKTIHSPRSLPIAPIRDFLSSEVNRMNPANTFNVDSEEDERDRRKQFRGFPEGTKQSEGVGNVRVGASLHRRSSVESNNSLVAAMRERYDTRLPSSPPREPPRLLPKASDLSTRYSHTDTRTSPHGSGSTSAQSGRTADLMADRFPTFQDKYPRSSRGGDRHRVPLDSPTLERDYFESRDDERSRYPDVPTMDRSYGDPRDRGRYHSRSPDQQYFDELGVRERQRNIDTIQEELALQKIEANLRRQERQLEIERAKLASAREGGYASDASRSHDGSSRYGRARRSESPGPMTSQQSLRPPPPPVPYDHSPNCGCQRCSAQHYASPPSPSPADRDSLGVSGNRSPVMYKPDPPIVLRPEKPKNWLRRMSMPVASLVSPNDKKTPELPGTVGRGRVETIALPAPDERIRRRSFELEHSEESSPRFGGTTRR